MNSIQLKVTRTVVYISTSMFLVMFGSATHAAGSVKAGHEKARMCETCHGLDGRSKVPGTPNLAGQIEIYLVAQLKAFKAGERKNEQMSVMVQALSPQDIENLAAYYSAIDIAVGKIPTE
jgi:cytochrome c553